MGQGEERPPSQSPETGGPPRGKNPTQRVGAQLGSRPLPPLLAFTYRGGPPTGSQATGRSSVPLHVGAPPHLHSPGSPGFTHLVPSPRSARSPPRTSSPRLPPCHPNVHRRLPRLGRCIRTSCIGRSSESPKRRVAIGYRRITVSGRASLLQPSLSRTEATSGSAAPPPRARAFPDRAPRDSVAA